MKDYIRQNIRNIRKNLSPDFVSLCSEAIASNLFNHDFKNVEKIMAYISIENEANPFAILKRYLTMGKEVYIPCLEGKDKIYPCRLLDFNSLVPGKYNVPEPTEKVYADIPDFDLILVPGIAFDLHGNRIGYGKGCYDGFLNELDSIKIGVCYEFQLVEEGLKPDLYDIPMNYILTEKEIYEVKDAL